MGAEHQTFYPGETTTPHQIVELADQYRAAAEKLLDSTKGDDPFSRAPFRFLAIHAIELYLNAFLVAAGCSASEIRGLQHDFDARTKLLGAKKLVLRKRTMDHLKMLSQRREYLHTRYDPAGLQRSKLNRVKATLDEIAKKVTDRVG